MEKDNLNFHSLRSKEEQIETCFNKRSVLWFTLGTEGYGIKIEDVQTVLDEYVLTPVPNSPKFVQGVINLRGTIIPVVDLKKIFQIPEIISDKLSMVVVLDVQELNNMKVGIVVDEVKEVLDIDFSELELPPPSLSGFGSDFVTGIYKMESHILIIVELTKIVAIAKEMIGKYT